MTTPAHCMHCFHWSGSFYNRYHAVIGGSRVMVGQCTNEEGEHAPRLWAENGAELAVFTQPLNTCPDFRAQQELEDEAHDIEQTDRSLDRQRLREAWL